MPPPEVTVALSVMDRLIDQEPKNRQEQPLNRAQSIRRLKASLRRDLDWLLNARRTPEPAGPEYQELERSLFNYGLPDITSLSWQSERDRTRLAKAIQVTLEIFEPRLKRIRVIPVGELSGTQFVLKFQIEGMLQMAPAPEHISFDTVLQISSGEYQVKGDPNAG